MNTTITISTSTPAKLYSQGSIRVSPYDLIKKYSVQDSPNSLSDSNLSSDDQQPIIPHNQKLSESEDFGFTDDDEEEEPGNRGSTRHFLPGPNGFKISGQKIQIYSDGSVTATDAGTGNLGGSGYSDSESDQESDDSSYDADCSVLESPRIVVKTSASEVPVKPPRRRSAEKDAARIAEDIERLQLQEERISSESQRASVSSDDMKTFPRSRISGHRPHYHQRHETQSGQLSEASLQSRSRSFNGSRESLNIFGSTDFKNLGISKNFSSDVIREVYGSKTSLLKHLDQQREERRLRQLEDGGRPLVPDHLSRSTDSVLSRPGDTQPVRSGEPGVTQHSSASHYKLRILFPH